MGRVRLLSRFLAVLVAISSLGAMTPARARPAPIGQDAYVLDSSYRGDFPDPSVLRVGSRWFAYSTTTANLNLPVLVSTDLRHWTVAGPRDTTRPDALPLAPAWAQTHMVGARRLAQIWAPTVVRLPSRKYAVVYTVRVSATRMCISVARSKYAGGPYVDNSTKPLLCPKRGVIDPSIYREGKGTYLLYKTEDAARGKPTRLWSRRIGRALRAFTAPKAHLLLRADPADWEHGVIEAPSMIRKNGRRYLFYSGNGWGSRGYSTGYAMCKSAIGPCTRPAGTKKKPHPERLLSSTHKLVGPGGASAFKDRVGRIRLAFHAWNAGATHYPQSDACRTKPAGCGQRRMHVALLRVGHKGLLKVRSAY